MPTENYKFPADFVWGAATSSYQIEGAVSEDGKGEDIWDVFTKEDHRIFEHHTGETACDHYHRFKEDVKLMKEIGLHAYRFSINWSRVLPNGYGQVNEKGIAFYNALINELLANDIEPYITLYHWELPYELYKRGGWLNPQIVDWFGDYARLIAERFSDRVKNFFTLNEPQCFVGLGFLTGEHAPGVQAPLRDTFEMAHNALKAHGKAVQMLRAYGKQKLSIGFAPTASMCYPETESAEDIEAARKAQEEADKANNSGNSSNTGGNSSSGSAMVDQNALNNVLKNHTAEDVAMLAAIIECEAGNQSYEGKCAVGSVVINRVADPRFANSISGVIYAPYQFSPVASGRFAIVLARGANAACTQAAVDVLNGYININALYFHVYDSSVDVGGTVIGDHVFY